MAQSVPKTGIKNFNIFFAYKESYIRWYGNFKENSLKDTQVASPGLLIATLRTVLKTLCGRHLKVFLASRRLCPLWIEQADRVGLPPPPPPPHNFICHFIFSTST